MNTVLEIGIYILLVIFIHILIYIFVKRKRPRSLQNRHVVITGGSSGIGLNTALECVKKGANVTIIARNIGLLEKAIALMESVRICPEQKLYYKSLDITKSFEEIAKCFDEIEKMSGFIYMLINCAGMAICGVFEEISVEDSHKLMDINYFGTYNCTRWVLPRMKAAREGIIIITGSQASLLGIYGYGPYAAAKFALRGMAETIAMESKHLGVSVTLALPADTNTPGFENEENSKPKETKIISGSGGLAKPEDVACKIINDALQGSFFSILGFESWLITLLCCGMSPWGNVLLNIFQAFIMGPLRIVGCLIQWNFARIIRQCAKEKKD